MRGTIDSSKTMFVIIDMQEKLVPVLSNVSNVVTNINVLIKAANLFSIPVIITEQYPQGLGRTIESLNTSFAKVISKTSFSCFDSSQFQQALQESKVENVVLCGAEAHVCVLKTALDALDLNLNVFVVSDAITSRDVENITLSTNTLQSKGAFIVSTEMLLFQLLSDSSQPEFKEVHKLVKNPLLANIKETKEKKSNLYSVPQRVSQDAHISSFEQYKEMYKESIINPELFWSKQARKELLWHQDFSQTKVGSLAQGNIGWFVGGKLNVSENCVDRHVPTKGNQVAIIWEGNEPGDVKKITYRELKDNVCRVANVLRNYGVKKGDRVAIYLPMVPEAAYAMLACARIGAIHSVVFAGFSAKALRDRVNDAQCKVVITADEGVRGSKIIPLKKTVDEAITACPSVENVFVVKRTGNYVPFISGRDHWLHEEMSVAPTECPIEYVDSEDPLFLLYTSGSTGKPKGVLHTSAGYLLYTTLTHKYVFDYRFGDVFACVADVGWITGHSYIVYGPLSNGATTLMFESTPLYPDAGRYWDIVERHKVTQFYTAPTAIRAIARHGDSFVKKYDRSTLRVLGTVGEPINPQAWQWYYDVVGEKRCSIVDTWWQTETGGIMITPLPGATAQKPGSATYPFFGIEPVLLDKQGNEIKGNGVSGLLAIKNPWPSMARTVYGDHERYMNTYLRDFVGHYNTGDGARRDEDGYYWITGRVDDVMNVSGHRLGTAEVESALVAHPLCAEAAVVGVAHEIKGVGIFAYVILQQGASESSELVKELREKVRSRIGPIATPEEIIVVPGLPKTRSGKIMRRILRKIANNSFDDLGDVSTLADPSVVTSIIEKKKSLHKTV